MMDIFNREKIENVNIRLNMLIDDHFSLAHEVDFLKKELEKMAKLTTKERNKIPKSKFALPAERKYPVEDKAHAKNAKARASEMEHKGKISKGTEAKIDARANRVLGQKRKRILKKS